MRYCRGVVLVRMCVLVYYEDQKSKKKRDRGSDLIVGET